MMVFFCIKITRWIAIVMVFFCIMVGSNSYSAVDKSIPKEIPVLNSDVEEWYWKMELYLDYIEKQLRDKFPERIKEDE